MNLQKNVRTFAQFTIAAALLFSFHAEARNCKKGKPCGNSCISQNDVCHKTGGASTTSGPSATTPAQSSVPDVPKSDAPASQTKTDSGAMTGATHLRSDSAPNTAKAKNCKKGKACGSSCISKDAVCHS